MNVRRALGVLFALGALSSVSHSVVIYPDEVDHTAFDDLLRSTVNERGMVNYQDLRTRTAELDAYLDRLARAKLTGMSREQRTAFWINAYNARVLRQILDTPRLDKIDPKTAFYDTAFPAAGGQYTLNDIEHRILRGKPNPANGEGPIDGVTLDVADPRVHFALCNGTLGSPPLKNFAYGAKNLDSLLEKNAVDFANSPQAVHVEKDRLVISNLMNDYAEDFEIGGGSAAFLSRRINANRRADAAEIKRRLATSYRRADFVSDWAVNNVLRDHSVK